MEPSASKQNSSSGSARILLCAPNVLRRTIGAVPANTWSLVGESKKSPWQGTPRGEIFSKAKDITGKAHQFELIPGLTLSSSDSGLNLKLVDSASSQTLFADHEQGFVNTSSGIEYWFNRSDEMIFGLGEKSGGLNKKHRRYKMRNTDALGYDAEFSDPLYKHWPFFIVKHPQSKLAVGIYFDQTNDISFDFGCEIDNYYGPYNLVTSKSEYLDQYFFVGSSVKEVSQLFSKHIGGQAFLPRWALGHLASTMKYTEADKPTQEIEKFIAKTDEEKMPCSAFHFSSGYSLFGKKRFVFQWNPERISDPKSLIAKLKDAGIKSAVNIKPCLLEGHPKFEDSKKQKLFIGQQDPGGEPLKVKFWDSDGAFLDFSNPLTVAWWKRQVKESLLENGVDCVWNDNNEFNHRNLDAAKTHSIEGFGKRLTFEDHRPLQTLLMVKASFEAQKEFRKELRPMQITRSGMPGVQRYSSTWTGDNYSSWHSLKFSTPIGLGLSLSGFGSFGHDVGGFAGPSPEPELLLRWVQAGIFQPRFCIHSWNSDGIATEPWMYSENKALIRKAIEQRYEILPYLYHAMFKQSASDEVINRPLFYDFPDDQNCYSRDFEFMCGSALLIAPIFEKDAKFREVYLPKGTEWYSLAQKKWFAGGQIISEPVSLNSIPVFIKDGSILAKCSNPQKLKGEVCDVIEVYISDKSSEAFGEIYNDDGLSMAYESAEFCITQVKAKKNSSGKINVTFIHKGNQKFFTEPKVNQI